MNASEDELLFDIETPLGFRVHCTRSYWLRKVAAQHPVMIDRIDDVKYALTTPVEVRLSRTDKEVFLFYARDNKRFVCAVARRTGRDGFLITTYPADKMKSGRIIWTK
jgi:hypothetical protein